MTIPLEELEEDPDNARLVFEDQAVQALADAMRAQGQLQPAIVRKVPSGKYRIVDGARRFRAAPRAGLKALRCEVRELSDEEAALAAATANLQRENLTEYEEARAYQRLLKLNKKLKVADLARLRGVAHNTVKNRLQLLDLPEDVGKRIGTNGFGAVHAKALQPFKDQAPYLAALLKAVDDGPVPNESQLRGWIRDVLEKAGVAVDPDRVVSYSIRDTLPDFEKRVKQLPHVELPTPYGRADLLVEPKLLKEKIEEWRKEALAKTQKATAERKEPARKAPSLAERLPERVRGMQTELATKKAKDLAKWDDDLQMALVGTFLRGCHAVTRKHDNLALVEASGLDAKDAGALVGQGNGAALAWLWPKHKIQVLRLVHLMLVFQNWSTRVELLGSEYSSVYTLQPPFDALLTGSKLATVKDRCTKELKDEAKAHAKPAKPTPKAKPGPPDKAVAKPVPPRVKKTAQELLKEAKQAKKAAQSAADKVRITKRATPAKPTAQAKL